MNIQAQLKEFEDIIDTLGYIGESLEVFVIENGCASLDELGNGIDDILDDLYEYVEMMRGFIG